ncbi:rhomboid family intramembrane serine protease [Treponema sp.]|uniref:rhomboid family intramembrane serine protease n=1 Tax=Treponema sp. TaxID=166 RepID=UPI003F0EDEF7
MARKNSLRAVFDSPVILVFTAVSAAFFIFDAFSSINISGLLFECHGAKSDPAFNFKSAADYARMIFYPLGFSGRPQFFMSMAFLLLLGPLLEERYGSLMLSLMLFITSLVGGVLTACLSPFSIMGAGGIVFMLVILSVLQSFIKKQVPFSWIFVFILFISFELTAVPASENFPDFLNKSVPVFIQLASGICGSLFGFFVCPKKRESTRKAQKTTAENSDYKQESSSSSDETIIGNISL